jgi:hypothetical protein
MRMHLFFTHPHFALSASLLAATRPASHGEPTVFLHVSSLKQTAVSAPQLIKQTCPI